MVPSAVFHFFDLLTVNSSELIVIANAKLQASQPESYLSLTRGCGVMIQKAQSVKGRGGGERKG